MPAVDIQLENPLWDYALTVYPSIEPDLLVLQQEGARVNYLLLALWMGQRGVKLDRFSAAADEWYDTYTSPVREIRYRLRDKRGESVGHSIAYDRMKSAELSLEQVELALLYDDYKDVSKLIEDAMHANLCWVIAKADIADPSECAERLLAKLIQS